MSYSKFFWIVLLMLSFLSASGQEKPCESCLLGKSINEPAVNYYAQNRLNATRFKNSLRFRGGEILINKDSIIERISFYRLSFDVLEERVPDLVSYLGLASTYKASLKVLKVQPIEKSKKSSKLKFKLPELGLSISVYWSDKNKAQISEFIIRLESKTQNDLPWCAKVDYGCPETSSIDVLKDVDPFYFWQKKLTDFNSCDLKYFEEQLGFKQKTYADVDLWMSPDKPFGYRITKNQRIGEVWLDVNAYTGKLPFNITKQTTLLELIEKFGLQYNFDSRNYELLLGKFHLSHGEGTRLMMTFVLNDARNGIDFIHVTLHPKYPKVIEDIQLEDFELPEVGCLVCSQDKEVPSLQNGMFRYANGYQFKGKISLGRPLKGEITTGLSRHSIADFESEDADQAESMMALAKQELESDWYYQMVKNQEAIANKKANRSCLEMVSDVWSDVVENMVDASVEFASTIEQIPKLEKGTSAYDDLMRKIDYQGNQLTSLSVKIKTEINNVIQNCNCREIRSAVSVAEEAHNYFWGDLSKIVDYALKRDFQALGPAMVLFNFASKMSAYDSSYEEKLNLAKNSNCGNR